MKNIINEWYKYFMENEELKFVSMLSLVLTLCIVIVTMVYETFNIIEIIIKKG